MKKKVTMILTALALAVATLSAQNITIKENGLKLSDLMLILQADYGYSFSIASDAVDLDRSVDLSVSNAGINEVLEKAFSGMGVAYTVNGKTIAVGKKPVAQAVPAPQKPAKQQVSAENAQTARPVETPAAPAAGGKAAPGTVSGMMKDENGEPLIGGSVMSKDGKRGAVTDVDGKYTLKLLPSDEVLVFSYFTYETQEVKIGGRAKIDVVMVPDSSNDLEEVVVIGYGAQKKQDLTGSVATVKMADIAASTATSVDDALQGRIAGVDIMSTGGDPGSASSIRIRGTRSVNASNEPLIVVDGIMDAVNDISDIDPNTIESISVLKDASSTAIYGSRGANGVIMITTKKAVSTKPSVTASISAGFSTILKKMDVMNAEEFIRYRNDAWSLNQWINGVPDPDRNHYSIADYPNTTDWQDEITRKIAWYRQASVSVNEKIGKKLYFWVNVTYGDEEGIIKKTEHQRLTFNTKFFRSFTDWLDVTLSMNGAFRNRDLNKVVISGSDQINGAVYLTPLMGRLDNFNPLVDSGYYIHSPGARLDYIDNWEKSYSRTDALKFTIKPFKDFWIDLQGSSYYLQMHRYRYWPSYMPGYVNNEGGFGYRNEWDRWNLNGDITVHYRHTVAKNHNFDVMAGFTASNSTVHNLTLQGQGVVSDQNKWNALAGIMSKSNYSAGTSETKLNKLSVLARFNYNYKGKYYFTFTGRADGSSNFADNNKWGFFPSGAVKWNIKKERFMVGLPWVSNLELRASVGLSGNDAIGSYYSHAAYGYTTSGYIFDGNQEVAYYPSRIENPDLTWEKTLMYNVALEGAFLKNRIKFTLEAYHSRTSDLLIWLQTPRTTGYSSRMTNIGRTRNNGIEFSLETHNIEKKHFGWTTTFTISHNDQRVEDIGEESYVSLINDKEGYMIYGYRKGYPLNALWGFQYAGVWHNQEEFERNGITHTYASFRNNYTAANCYGHSKFVDVNRDGVLDEKDRIYLGQADPIVQGGFQNNFHIGPVKLSVYLAYSIGGKIFNYSELFMAGSSQSNQYKYMLNSWHYSRPDSDLPRANDNYRLLSSSFQVHDASYLRLKNVSVTYPIQFKAKNGKPVVKSLELTLSGDNLWLWCNYNGFDPDVTTSSSGTNLRRVDMNAQPRARTVVFTAKIKL